MDTLTTMTPHELSTSLTDELQAIFSGLVGGARYGMKIRLPHALVMTFLFRRDLSNQDKLRTVLTLVWEHTKNLASFATIYKSILLSLKLLSRSLRNAPTEANAASTWRALGRWILDILVNGPLAVERSHKSRRPLAPPGHPDHTYHSFVAGAIGGYFVWGHYSSVNQQIVLYLASRVLVGLWNRAMLEKQQRRRHVDNGGMRILEETTRTPTNSQTFSLVAAIVWGVVMALWEESPTTLQSSLKKSMDEIYRHDSFPSWGRRRRQDDADMPAVAARRIV